MQTQTHAFFILFILILIQSIKSQETQCNDIKPKSAADCQLANSGIDKAHNKYCCFQKPYLDNPARCVAYPGFLFPEPCYNATNLPPNDCEYIVPEKASDCVLSENDKKKYDYCCYVLVLDGGEKYCSAETKDSYEMSLSVFKAFATNEDIFDCGVNKGSFMDLSNILLVLIIILNMCV